MRYLGPTSNARLNEACAVVFLFIGLFLLVGLASYQPFDSSLNTLSSAVKPANLTGRAGAYLADFLLQTFGIAAYAIPAHDSAARLEMDSVCSHPCTDRTHPRRRRAARVLLRSLRFSDPLAPDRRNHSWRRTGRLVLAD